MSGWAAAVAPALVALVLLTLPGAAVLLGARLPARLVLGVAPAVSGGLLGLAVAWTTLAHVPWGLGPLLLTCALATAAATLAHRWGDRRGRGSAPARSRARGTGPGPRARAGAGALRAGGLRVLLPAWALAAVVGVLQLAQAIGRPDALQQSHDAPFHLLATREVLWHGSASWWVVGGTSTPDGRALYPSALHGLAALVVDLSGADLVVGVTAVVLVLAGVLWPLGVLALADEIGDGSPVVTWTVALAVPWTLVFPALLLRFGALWANLAALSLLPGALALVAAACRRTSTADAPGRALTPSGRALALLLAAAAGAGLMVVHPSAVLSGLVVAGPLVLAAGVRLGRGLLDRHPGRRAPARVGLLLLALALVVVAAVVVRSDPVQVLLHSDVRAVTSTDEALRQVLAVGTTLTPGWAALGVLVLVGCVGAWRGRRRWLVVAHLLTATLWVFAASVSTGWGTLVTVLWDREPYRIAAALALTALPLAGLGAATAVDLAGRAAGRRGRTVAAALVAAALLAVVPSAHASVLRVVGHDYGDQQWWRTLVTRQEAELYRRVLGPRQDGALVAGDPFGGAHYAGLVSGHPNLVNHFGGTLVGDRDLLRRHLREMTPPVCAAMQRLDVRYVVEDTDRVWDDDPRFPAYVGLRDLAGVPGLTVIGRAGPVTVYEVTGCGAGRSS